MGTTVKAPAGQEAPSATVMGKAVKAIHKAEAMFATAGNAFAFACGKALVTLIPDGRTYVQGVSITSILKTIAEGVTEAGQTVSYNTLQQRRKVELAFPEKFRESLAMPIPWSTWQTLVTYRNYEGRSEECLEWIRENVTALADGGQSRELARARVKARNPNAFETVENDGGEGEEGEESGTGSDGPVDQSLGLTDQKALQAWRVVRDVISGAMPVQPDTFATIVAEAREVLSNVPENVPDSEGATV